MTVGEKLRELRHRRGWSAQKLSKKSNINPSLILQYEAGFKQPGFKNVLILAKALKVSLKQFDKCSDTETPETPEAEKGTGHEQEPGTKLP